MLTDMRRAVAELLRGQQFGEVYEYVPSDVAAYPCIVVGRPGARPSDEATVVFNIFLDVYVCGRPQSDDAQEELDKTADAVWQTFGGTRTRRSGELVLSVTEVVASVIALAGNQNIPAYELTVESAITTC